MISVLLRFRDVDEIDTINEHRKILRSKGDVFWGWWRKKTLDFDHDQEFFSQIKKEAQSGHLRIGLYDRSRERYYFAELEDLYFEAGGSAISSPSPDSTPHYYRDQKFPAWFKLCRIEKTKLVQFTQKFGEVPLGEPTLYPVGQWKSIVNKGLIDGDYIELESNHILHVSDIHLGEDHGEFKDATGTKSLPNILKHDLQKIGILKIGLLVQSGDLTSKANISVLQSTGASLMTKLCTTLQLDKNQVLMIPGNHDYSLADLKQEGYDHTVGYNTFIEKFYGRPMAVPYLYKYVLPSGRRVEVLTIDSIKLRTRGTSNYGWVEWKAYEGILNAERSKHDEKGPLRIAIIHHHLAPAPRIEVAPSEGYDYASVSVTLNAGEVVEGLQEHGFSIVLHGHQHSPAMTALGRGRSVPGQLDLVGWDQRLFLIAGGSAGAGSSRLDQGFLQNSYGLLTIEDDHVLHRVRRYTSVGNVSDHYQVRFPIEPYS